jgi:D,D-heptose 1,7-bisphosphate phosphatase
MRRAIFLDKDGTLIPDIPYNADPEKITLLPKMVEGLRLLRMQGYLLIIISNQAGLAFGRFTQAQLDEALARLRVLFEEAGIVIDDIYYCPHHVDGTVPKYRRVCDCRKPSPGLLIKAALEHNIDLAGSWMIGDILNDVESGNRVGCRSILIDNGNETEWLPGTYRKPTFICSNINNASMYIYNKGL